MTININKWKKERERNKEWLDRREKERDVGREIDETMKKRHKRERERKEMKKIKYFFSRK